MVSLFFTPTKTVLLPAQHFFPALRAIHYGRVVVLSAVLEKKHRGSKHKISETTFCTSINNRCPINLGFMFTTKTFFLIKTSSVYKFKLFKRIR